MKDKRRKNIRKTVSRNDPFGSYTGNSLNGDVPEQDADDL